MSTFYEIREVDIDGQPDTTHTAALNLAGDYIGTPDVARMLCDERGISPEPRTPGKVCSIGFCEREQKWYGWSHRALYGFGVGSTVDRGDCAYIADTPEGLIDDHAEFYADIGPDVADRKRAECQILPDRSGIRILHEPQVIPMLADAGDLGAFLEGDEIETEMTDIAPDFTIVKVGRGKWTAQTFGDAKEMAIAFAESVS